MLALDPRTKLYLLLLANLLLFFHVDMWTQALMMGLFILPFFLAGRWKNGLRFLVIYAILLAFEVMFIPLVSGFWLNLISLLVVGLGMMLPCLVTGAYAFTTTTPSEFSYALRQMRMPEGIVITSIVVLRFFPTVWEDYKKIRGAMALRGIHTDLRHPAQLLEYLLIPLLMNSSMVARDLSVAALTKGIGIHGKHTSMVELHVHAYDWLYALLCTLPLGLYLGGVL
jgi:energy-coupling factor transport system permease protein